jgi:glycosyltransferase involved in cell wall biosynthesis
MHLIIDCTTTQNQLKHHGIGQYTKHIVKGISEKEDIDITLLMFDGESTIDEYLKGKNIHIHRLGPVKQSDYKNIFTYFTKILPAIKKVKQKNSIYFCPYFWIGVPSRVIPTVLMVHDFILPIYNIYSEKGFIQNTLKRVLYWLEMNKAKRCKAILTNSKHTTKDFRKYFPKYPKKNIYTIYLDGELEESKNIKGWDSKLPKDYSQRGYFIYMGGTLSQNKNSDGVVRGYREFLVKLNNSKRAPYLVIAGKNFTKDDDPQVAIFKDRIKCLGLKDSVIFTGFYEDKHAKPLLSNSISFIHLSLYEGFGISVVEAMRADTPVIAHKGSCYPEVIGDAGILVDGKNEKEVGKAMYEIYTDDRLRDRLIKKGKEIAQRYSWGETVDKLYSVVISIEKSLNKQT